MVRSGYEVALARGDVVSEPDPGLVEAMLDAANAWAGCARDNGCPQVKDAQLPTPEVPLPAALLPDSITEEELGLLLERCPLLSVEAARRNDELRGELGEGVGLTGIPADFTVPPLVGIDHPGFRSGTMPVIPGELDPEAERLARLQEVLWEKQLGR
jgi:hypothetical protein